MKFKGNRRKIAVIGALVAIALLLIALALYVSVNSLVGGGGRFRPAAELELVEVTDGGWYVLEVIEVGMGERLPLNRQPTDEALWEAYSLANIHVTIWNGAFVVNNSEKDVTLSQAVANYQDESYGGNVTFLDADESGMLSAGDLLLLKSENSGGVLKEGFKIELSNWETGGFFASYTI